MNTKCGVATYAILGLLVWRTALTVVGVRAYRIGVSLRKKCAASEGCGLTLRDLGGICALKNVLSGVGMYREKVEGSPMALRETERLQVVGDEVVIPTHRSRHSAQAFGW